MSDAPGGYAPGSTSGPPRAISSATSLSVPPGTAGTQSSCQTCGAPRERADPSSGASSFVYAVGRIEPRFPTLGLEKELAQAIGKASTANLSDREAMHAVLSRPDYLYIVRQLCWVLTIKSMDAYAVVPRDAEDLKMVLSALRPTPRDADIDVAVGWVGPVMEGRACNGLRLPTITLAQLYSFDVESFIKHLPKPQGTSDPAFAGAVEEVLQRASQLAGNMGYLDEHRALNYLVARDPSLYAEVADHYARNAAFARFKVNLSPLAGTRRVMEVVLEFRNRETDVFDRRFVNVDVSDVFPFKLNKWAPYVDR